MFHKLLISLLLILFTTQLSADEEEAAEMFKEAQCMSCHNKEDFSPEQRKRKNFNQLHNSVKACQLANDAEWFDDETKEVAKYLNKKYYNYEEKK